MLIARTIKYWWQRRTRGWDDRCLWSLDVSLAEWILPRLRAFQECTIGVPCSIEGYNLDGLNGNTEYEKARAEWLRILGKMIISFELILKDGEGEILTKKEYAQIDEGIELFGKYLRNLWW